MHQSAGFIWLTWVLPLVACTGEVPAGVAVGSVGSVTHSARASCVVDGAPCEVRHACRDVYGDACDPLRGDEGCKGTCWSCDDPALARTYAETNHRSCSRIRLYCEETQRPFNDACGCGCERIVPGAR